MPKIEPFEKFADEYDNWFDNNKIIYESELLAIKQLLPSGKGIEIGVGTGRFALPLGIGDGVEPSLKMREIAKKRGINVIEGVAEKIPVNNNSYDYVLLVTTLCFLDDVDQALQEIGRILKIRGEIIIGFIDKTSPIGRKYVKLKDKNPFYKPANFYSTKEIMEILKRNGFNNFNIVQTLYGNLKEIREVQEFTYGFRKGSFIVIKAQKVSVS